MNLIEFSKNELRLPTNSALFEVVSFVDVIVVASKNHVYLVE
jgi:hypothetical protein